MKKEKRLMRAIGQVDDAYIEEAAPEKRKRKRSAWPGWAAAACLCLAIAGLAAYQSGLSPALRDAGNSGLSEQDAGSSGLPGQDAGSSGLPGQDAGSSGLPTLSISENMAGMGYEGYMAYDISELVNANPWSEAMELSTLPVYKNVLSYDEYSIVSGADFDKMRTLILDVAGRLGLDTEHLSITDDTPDEKSRQAMIEKFKSVGDTVPEGYFAPTKWIIQSDGVRIEADVSMTATITFDPAIPLPEKYEFSHYASYDDQLAVAEYLKSAYADLIGMDHPQINIHDGDYDIYNRQSYWIEFFDADTDAVRQIINYNFNRVAFYCSEDGKLCMARIFQPDLSNKTGDYPIISPKQARELLSEGSYLTTVPYEMPGAQYIKKVELIYRTSEHEEYFMPYYRFYVELPEEERENGMKTYGAYYVPAVESSYISNMPTWDGTFNY